MPSYMFTWVQATRDRRQVRYTHTFFEIVALDLVPIPWAKVPSFSTTIVEQISVLTPGQQG